MDAIFEAVERLSLIEKIVYGALAIPVAFFAIMVLMVACFWAMAWGMEFVSSWPWPSITE